MQLFSRERLNPQSAEVQLRALTEFGDGVFTPEKCDVYEPLRERFDPNDLARPIGWLSQNGGEMKFKRRRSISVEGYIQNARFPKIWTRDQDGTTAELKPTAPEPVFCTRWVVWIDASAERREGVPFLRRFLLEMSQSSRADYGFLATESDYRRKNFLIIRDDGSIREKFAGDDPEKGLPGLYWMNLFGHLYVDWFKRARIDRVSASFREEFPDGSVLLQFGETSDASEAAEAQALQRTAIELLGGEAFFDIQRPDRLLVAPSFMP